MMYIVEEIIFLFTYFTILHRKYHGEIILTNSFICLFLIILIITDINLKEIYHIVFEQ